MQRIIKADNEAEHVRYEIFAEEETLDVDDGATEYVYDNEYVCDE